MQSLMEKEAFAAPIAIEKQFSENIDVIKDLCRRLKKKPPLFAVTDARGSSDHAATFAKYLLETFLGLVTSSAAPSVVTLYNSKLNLKNSLVIGISQSGQSPDVCEVMQFARKKRAITVAFVNKTGSPLAKAAEYVIPLHAGQEKAVAATKSYIASIAALIQFVAYYANDKKLIRALDILPEKLDKALACDWKHLIKALLKINNTLVIARGYGYPIAQEAALKFKETTSIHAESFSGAEVLHGPFALIKKNDPILMFAQNDASLKGMLALYQKIKSIGAKPFLALPKKILAKTNETILPLPETIHPVCDPLLAIQAFYPMISRLALKKGKNPDKPENLSKVTKTK